MSEADEAEKDRHSTSPSGRAEAFDFPMHRRSILNLWLFPRSENHVIWITARREYITAGYGLMSSPGAHRLRLVIQRVEEGYPPRSTYRLLAHPAPSGVSLRLAKFHSREEVINCLQAALPEFDPSRLGTGLQTQIVFAEDIELNEAQLLALGVTG